MNAEDEFSVPLAQTKPYRAPSFPGVARTAEGHFVLVVFEAVLCLLQYAHRLCRLAGRDFDAFLDGFPFLAEYLKEIENELPAGIDWVDARVWWKEQMHAWEQAAACNLPLTHMVGNVPDARESVLMFVLGGIVEDDSRFGSAFAELQHPLPGRRPGLELLGQILSASGEDALTASWRKIGPLIDGGYLTPIDESLPRAEWSLRVPPVVWDAAKAGAVRATCGELVDKLAHVACQAPTAPQNLIYPPWFLDQVARLPEVLLPADGVLQGMSLLVLRARVGADVDALVQSVAHNLGRGILSVAKHAADGARVPVGPLATLLHAIPFVQFQLGPGETVAAPRFAGYDGLVICAIGMEGGIAPRADESLVTLDVPDLDQEMRRRLWDSLIEMDAASALDEITWRFQIGSGFVRRVARDARAHAEIGGRRTVSVDDVREAARGVNRQQLDNLAAPLAASATWSELISSATTTAKLFELERRCRFRERLLANLGQGFGGNANRGVRALFSGTSGTGKTYAARILAAELGKDIYRVDLASVVNKYIGETEKNLHQVLSRAEALDVVLLLDEGDSLLGGRTEVRSANDRYANLETNYLLQRLESYQGILIVTTNLGDNIDSAFQRRMDVVVPFLPPNANERLRILELHLPDAHAVPVEELARIARKCRLTGGQIRNAVQHASLLALADGSSPVTTEHLHAAMLSEYQKSGGIFPLAGPGTPREGVGGVGGFIAAMTDSGF